jgi:hypothetical protein
VIFTPQTFISVATLLADLRYFIHRNEEFAMRKYSIVLTMILLLAGGCAAYRNDNLSRMLTLPQHYAQFDIKLAWEVKAVEGSTVIDGAVKNIRYYEMDELEIWVSSLDAEGKEVHRAADFVYSLKENEVAQFTLKIPPVAPGSRLRFMYRYIGHEGGGDSGGAQSWRQSFESEVP